MGRTPRGRDTVNTTLDREPWNSLAQNAHERSLFGSERFPTIKALRWAIRVFQSLEPIEIDEILKRKLFSLYPTLFIACFYSVQKTANEIGILNSECP